MESIPEEQRNPKLQKNSDRRNKKKKRHKKTNGQDPGPPVSEKQSTNRESKWGYIGTALQRLKEEYKKHYYFSDDQVIDLVLGVVAGNHFDSDPIWLHLISPPSGGKTEILNSVFDCDETYFLSDFTAASLISGYKNDEKEGGEEEYSLLPKLDSKVVVTKDFSLIHDKPADSRSQILSILRDVYDGYASRALGNSTPKGFHSRFNYLTGMTPDIEKSWSLNTLGERFLMYRMQIDDRRAHARQSLRNANNTVAIRKRLQAKVKEFIDIVPKDVVPELDAAMEERVLDLSDLLSMCRTYVYRERNDEMLFLPVAELASRVAKQLLRVGQSLALVRGRERVSEDEFRVMKRIALDSLPTNRRHLVAALWEFREAPTSLERFEKATGLSKSVTRRNLNDLNALGVVTKTRKNEAGNKNKTRKSYYQLSEQFTNQLDNVGGL